MQRAEAYLIKSALTALKAVVAGTPGGKVLQKSVGSMPGGQIPSKAGKATKITK